MPTGRTADRRSSSGLAGGCCPPRNPGHASRGARRPIRFRSVLPRKVLKGSTDREDGRLGGEEMRRRAQVSRLALALLIEQAIVSRFDTPQRQPAHSGVNESQARNKINVTVSSIDLEWKAPPTSNRISPRMRHGRHRQDWKMRRSSLDLSKFSLGWHEIRDTRRTHVRCRPVSSHVVPCRLNQDQVVDNRCDRTHRCCTVRDRACGHDR